MDHPEQNYIAIEGQSNVVRRALQKAEENSIANLRIFITYVSDLKEYFDEGELSTVYLLSLIHISMCIRDRKKEDTHKMAEANRAFAHFRW